MGRFAVFADELMNSPIDELPEKPGSIAEPPPAGLFCAAYFE
jgi:hypothetical protein